ncbi:hypothetical protein [Anabaena sp. CCY 0017]|uniref:hypothetical protein n=1 Tax=Anabaena sp. CCY 0017 TaxID=3103866 RepID=UPI0039C5DC66
MAKTQLSPSCSNLRFDIVRGIAEIGDATRDKSSSLSSPLKGAEFNTHAVDGVALAASAFVEYRKYHTTKIDGADWFGSVTVTPAIFKVICRPPYSRRQLHLMLPAKGGLRHKYGGSTTRHGLRKGDLVKFPQGIGYVSGDTEKQVSVSNANWKRLGQIASSKVQLIRRSNGLIVA